MNPSATWRGYFAAKLTNLRHEGLHEEYSKLYEDVAQRLERIQRLKLHAPHRLTDPHATTPDHLNARDIYLVDRLHVTHTDVMIACVELPSFGVGAELQMAVDSAVPVVAFYYAQSTRDPSRLVVGMPTMDPSPSPDGSVILRYAPTPAGRENLLDALATRVAALTEGSPPSRTTSRTTLAAQLDKGRIARGLTIDDLAVRAAVPRGTIELLAMAGNGLRNWLTRPEVRRVITVPHDEVMEDRVLLPSLWAVERIAQALDLSVHSPQVVARS